MSTNIARIKRSPLAGLLAVFYLWAVAAQADYLYTPWTPIFKGIERTSGTNTQTYAGVPHSIQALRIDLQDPDVRIFTTPPNTNNYVANSRETLSQTPGTFLRANRLKVAVNGAHYGGNTSYTAPDGTAEWVHGMVVSQGQFVSPYDGFYGAEDSDSLMYFTSNKVASFIPYNSGWFSDTTGMHTAIPGMYALVVNGVNVGYNYSTSSGIHGSQPRTAIGHSQDGRYLILLTIDGRQPDVPGNDGAIDSETANWLILFGAYNGMNLDGGGSSCMVMANECGDPVVLNDPSVQYTFNPYRIGWQRSVGHNIGISAKSLPVDFIRDPGVTSGRSMAVLSWDTATPATAQIEYGTTAGLGTFTPLDANLTTNHILVLAGLTANTTNYFRLISQSNGVPFSTPVCSFVTLVNQPLVVFPSNNFTQVFPLTQSWRYNSNSLDGVQWTKTNYNDAGWMGEGPGLLYIEDNPAVAPRNTPLPSSDSGLFAPGVPPSGIYKPPITYYFRTTFQFPVNPAGVMLVFSNYLDDGAVWYLNGTEVNRLHMPDVPNVITYTTYANSVFGTGEATAPEVFNLSGPVINTNLVQGLNTLAVEVHNYKNPTGGGVGTDLVFGMALLYGTGAQTTNSLVVLCSDIQSNAPITLTPSDNYGGQDGATPFERTYYSGANVQLTAAATLGEKIFKRWKLDGADYSTNLTISVAMSTNRVMTAVYEAVPTIVNWAVSVASSNPTNGVNMQVTPPDLNTNSGGIAPLTLVYTNGSMVTLTAPASAGANSFLKWRTNGVDFSTNRVASLAVVTNLNVVAVYATPVRTLTVQSASPASGVSITLSPADLNTNGSGATPFVRSYLDGATVTATAPAAAGTAIFVKWQLDGEDFATSRAVNVAMNTNHVLVAVYQTILPPVTWTLNLATLNPTNGVNLQASPPDLSTNSGGLAPQALVYTNGTVVTVTAPAFAGVNYFLKWQTNGVDFSTNRVASLTVVTNLDITAVYATPIRTLTVQSANPDSGVMVAVSPADLNTNGNDATPFVRSYLDGANVTVTAPAAAGTAIFVKWQLDGADYATSLAVNVAMNTNHLLLAVYETVLPPVTWALNLATLNPTNGVNLQATPPDLSTNSGGEAPLALVYTNGSVVTLTAPALAGANYFLKWQLDGMDYASNLTANVVMDTNHTLVAVYATPIWQVSINSANPTNGVAVEVMPLDLGTNGNGATPLARTYLNRTQVTFTAPDLAGANRFSHWTKDGTVFSSNRAAVVTVDTNLSLTAVYLSPPVPPPLTIQTGPNYVVINWTNSGFVLQQSTNLGLTGWTNLPGPVTAGPYTNPIIEPAQYFRLQQQPR